MEAFESIGRSFIPKRYQPRLHSYLQKAGMQEIPYSIFGIIMIAALFMAAATFIPFYQFYLRSQNPIVTSLVTFLYLIVVMFLVAGFVFLVANFFINIRIYNRTKRIESVFGDYLTLVVTNLKGGMSFERSLWMAIRPQFDVLADEITIVAKKVMTGNDMADALREFSLKYDSPMIRRNVNLIIGELRSGGEIANVIDKVIDNIAKTKALQEEMSTAVLSFVIFIAAIVCVIAPILFALSYHILEIIISFAQKIGTGASGSAIGVDFSSIAIDPANFRNFSFVALGTISLFSSFIVSIIEKGDIRGGLKYMPMFVATSLVLYVLFYKLLSLVLGNLVL